MERILSSIDEVVTKSKHVSINQLALEAFADSITPKELEDVPPLFEKDDNLSLEQSIAFGFVYNAINFSYWGEPKWTINVDGKDYDGGIGMLRALQRGIQSGYDLLSAEYLRTIPKEDLSNILKGNVEIPLFKERLKMLRSLGRNISGQYGGSFTSFIEDADWDAVKLVENLADKMPVVFDDEETYSGNSVKFYKRAQLVPSHLHELKQLGVSAHDITQMDELTALADYKVPQVLRKHGVLAYTDDLSRRIDALLEIEAGSTEEIEIRVMTIWAVELLVRYMRQQGKQASAIQVDHILWLRGQEKSLDDKPYHRTRTTNY
ncbi:hypothetical protein KC952_01240 [Candidatus Saccharibacteria bacterium]|nr:hypothetical protein [Candidatus Saccharibacteria bacterium]